MRHKIKLYYKAIVNLGMASIIVDIITPLLPCSLYASIALFLCFFVSYLLFLIPGTNLWLKSKLPDTWYLPIGSVLIIGSIVMMSLYIAGKNSVDERGMLAEHFSAFEELQRSFGIIEVDVLEIAERTAAIDERIGTLELEVSGDPRKELSNLGVIWSSDAYDEAIRMCDLQTITLFLDGGMPPGINFQEGKGGTKWLMRQNTTDKYNVFDLLLSKGLDPDIKPKNYIYTRYTLKDYMIEDPVMLELMIKHGMRRKEAIACCNQSISEIEKVYAHPCYKWPTVADIPKRLNKETVRKVVGPRDPYRSNEIRMLRMTGNDSTADSRELLYSLEDGQKYELICKNTLEMNQPKDAERRQRLEAFKQIKKRL